MITPSFYTTEDGGRWQPWTWGALGRSALSAYGSDNKSGVHINCVNCDGPNFAVFALCFGEYDSAESLKWDCLHGFRHQRRIDFGQNQQLEGDMPPPDPWWEKPHSCPESPPKAAKITLELTRHEAVIIALAVSAEAYSHDDQESELAQNAHAIYFKLRDAIWESDGIKRSATNDQ